MLKLGPSDESVPGCTPAVPVSAQAPDSCEGHLATMNREYTDEPGERVLPGERERALC